MMSMELIICIAVMRWCSALVFLLPVIFVSAETNSYENDDITLERDPAACKSCEVVQDIDDEVYYLVAQVSMKKYQQDQGFGQYQLVKEVTRVYEQNLSGRLFIINFNTVPSNCTVGSNEISNGSTCQFLHTPHYLSCILIIRDHSSLNKPEISCKNQSRINILGGLSEQNPSSPKYRDMAEESFMKYMKDNCLDRQHEILQVKKVTTQVVEGIMTRIDFNAKLDFSNVISCHSEIWDRPWLNQKEINVTCVEHNNKQKRQVPGGLTEHNVNDPVYRDMAKESLIKYMKDHGLDQQHEILQVKKVTTQVVAGIITRIDFNAKLDFSNVISCHSEIWDRPWLNKKEINVTCVEHNNKQKRQVPGGLTEQNVNDPVYRDMAKESLIKYMKDHGLDQQHEILQVKKVTTQVVAGIITRIDFNAKLDFSNVISCHSEIWDRPWLNKKEIIVTCVEHNNKQKRQVPGGLTEHNVNDPVYRDMAKESLIKYMKDHGLDQQHEILQVKKVTTQVVAGIITRIDFNAKLDFSNVISCHSEIWDRPWLNKKEINVTCVEHNNKQKRQVPGGLTEENVNDPVYRDMAKDSLIKYMKDHGLDQQHEILQVKKVTTQVVAGIITRIDFNAKLDFSNVISCHSEIWDRPWLNKKEINVTCVEHNNKQKRQVPGGLTEQNVNDPVYRDMAKESLIKYMKDHGLDQQHEILQVKKVTTQVVAGIITRIDFNAKLDFSNVISCHSEIWDRPWLNKKEINVTCVEHNNKQKRQVPGGLTEQNVNDPVYRDMAKESLIKYMKDHGLDQQHEILQVKKVTTQVVAGIITRIDFNAKLDFSNVIFCHSEIWDRPWLNKKEINVTCVEHNNKQKRQVPGGLTEQNVNDPVYRDMAKESLIKYMKDHGLDQQHEILQVKKVTTQVVAGIITRIDFNAKLDFSNVISCHSEIWDRPWLNKKEINVTCVEHNNKQKRQVLGGLKEQNVNDPVYRDMAKDSLIKYMKDHGLDQQHEILQVKKVTTQVVAGILTRIDFNAKLDFSNVISCHSEIWDRPWLNKKEINVTCVEHNNKQKREIPGGLWV